jgi:hypothetical protein
MAGEGISVDVPFPRIDFNPAIAGKFEAIPDMIPQLTKDFQIGTNMVETAWVNQYQYQQAQYALQESAAKLRGLDTEDDLNRQTFEQRASLYPLQQRQAQQTLDQNANILQNQQYEIQQRQLANQEMVDWSKAVRALDYKDPDFYQKLAELDGQYSHAASSQYTAGERQAILAGKLGLRQNSSVVKMQNNYLSALETAQQQKVLDPNLDINQIVANGGGAAALRQANQTAAEKRIKLIQNAIGPNGDPNDSALLNRLMMELSQGRQQVNAAGQVVGGGANHFNADGTLDDATSNQILQQEYKYKLLNPYGKATRKIVNTYDPTTHSWKPSEEISGLTVTEDDMRRLQGATEGKAPGTPKDYKYNLRSDPDYTEAEKQVRAEYAAKGNQNPELGAGSKIYARNIQDEYEARRKAKGLPPSPTQDEIDKQYQASQTATSSTTPPGAVTTPTQTQPNLAVPQPTPPTTQPAARPARTPTPGTIKEPKTTPVGTSRRRGMAYTFPEEEAPPGSWQAAWNTTVGQFQGPTQEETARAIEESLGRGAQYASAEGGVPAGWRSEYPSPSQGGGGGSNYRAPEDAPDTAGINHNVWSMVMNEEGPDFGPDGNHPSVFGLWGDKPGVEGQAYNLVRAYGARSTQAFTAVTNAWTQGFLRESQPWALRSPGMQGLVISDSQHQGGAAAERIIASMGGWDAINRMDPRRAVEEYSRLRRYLWPGNEARVNREENWALSNA